MKKYTNNELNDLLIKTNSIWENIDFKYIKAEFIFKSFIESINFVNFVSQIAEDLNYHLKYIINYNKVIFDVFTHSENAITELDILNT
ncbi:MAG: 4a-hydroxytetrahydrobiopterin dehydratase [Candidatus Sericytochromatia bacterium]